MRFDSYLMIFIGSVVVTLGICIFGEKLGIPIGSLEPPLAKLLEKLLCGNAKDVGKSFFLLRHPILIVLRALIPVIGGGQYGMLLKQQYKASLFTAADLVMAILGPGYIVYKLILTYDQIEMGKRMLSGKEL